MPFSAPFRLYTTGDFLFGIADTINTFIEDHRQEIPVVGKAERMGKPVVTVRQLSEKRSNAENSFLHERRAQNLAYLDSLEKQLKYQQTISNADQSDIASNAKFRAKSKGALHHCIANQMHLHFLLDGLDLKSVIAKDHAKDAVTVDGKLRSVTGAELRWIYRHKDCPKTQTYVQFRLNGAACVPPWSPEFNVQGAPSWAAYVPTTGNAAVG